MKSFLFLFLALGSMLLALPASASTTSAVIGQRVQISVAADGTQPFTYQWFKNGTAIEGATAAVLTLPAAALSDAATYTVQVSNPWGSTLSDEAVLTVKGQPPSKATTTISLSATLNLTIETTALAQASRR